MLCMLQCKSNWISYVQSLWVAKNVPRRSFFPSLSTTVPPCRKMAAVLTRTLPAYVTPKHHWTLIDTLSLPPCRNLRDQPS